MEDDMENELEDTIQDLQQDVMFFKEKYQQIQDRMEEVDKFRSDLEEKVDIRASNIDFDALEDFVQGKFWLVNQLDENEYEVWIPQFIDSQVGKLDRSIRGYNVFIVDDVTKMMSEIPEFLSDEIDLDTEQDFKVKGDLLEFSESKKDVVEEELDDHVENIEDDKATIKRDKQYSLVRELLERGEIPFTPEPVDPDDLRDVETEHELRDYQEDAFQEWVDHGALTVSFMTGSGKTHVAMEALDALKYDEDDMRKAVVVYSKITEQKWRQDIREYAPRLEDEVEIVTYQSLHKIQEKVNDGKEYGMIVFDESDFIPAPNFSKASSFPIKYRMGLSASPKRSDGEEDYVFALCGKPYGMDWKNTAELMDKQLHEIFIHASQDEDERVENVKSLIDPEKTTMVFVDFIDDGERLSDELGLEFVHGESSNQLDKINDAIAEDNAVIVSRIADRGISISNLQQIIEIPTYDSGRQAIQRTGRLLHGQGQEHHMVYTLGMLNKHKERFYRLIEKGFKLKDVDDVLEIDDLQEQKGRTVDVDFDYDSSEVDKVSESIGERERSSSSSRFDDPIEFLKDEKIKEEINDRIEDGRFSKEKYWEALIGVASGDIESHEDIEMVLDVNTGTTLTKIFREDPKILNYSKDGSPELEINVEEWNKMREEIEKKNEKKQKIQELKEEVM